MKTTKNILLVLGGGVLGAVLLLGSGMVSAHGFGFGFRGGNIADIPQEKIEQKAELLGISAGELTTAIEAGESLKDIAEEQGITQEDLRAAHRAQKLEWKTERLNQLVADGQLTQEEADAKLEALSSGEWFGLKIGHVELHEEHQDGDWQGKGHHYGKHRFLGIGQ